MEVDEVQQLESTEAVKPQVSAQLDSLEQIEVTEISAGTRANEHQMETEETANEINNNNETNTNSSNADENNNVEESLTAENDENQNASLSLDDATCKSANQQPNGRVKTAANDDLGDLDNLEQADDEIDDGDALLKDLDSSSPNGGGGGGNVSYSDSGNNVYTFRKTEWDVKKMENYVKLTFGDSTAMEKMDPPLLNGYLKSFFEHAKKSDGMDYEPESLIGFMNSYERYLKTKGYPESLLRSDAFKESRTILKNKRELVRSIGKLIRTKSKDTCFLLQFHRNTLKEKGLLGRDNPDGLLAEVYLNNTIYFGEFLKEDKAWRGNLNLVWGDILLERDPENGLEYLTLSISVKRNTSAANKNAAQQQQIQPAQPPQPKTINRVKTGTQTSKLRAAASTSATSSSHMNNEMSSPRVYARQPSNLCPVEAYKMFKARRPNTCLDRESPFYLAPNSKSKFTSKVWYKALAMSCQRLDALFYCLFKKALLDINQLANMSEAEQAQIIEQATAVSQAASDVVVWKANRPNVVHHEPANVSGGKAGGRESKKSARERERAESQQQLNQQHEHLHHHHHHGKTINQMNNYHQQNQYQQQVQPSIITTVPVQVQVQVQIQVQPAQSKQHLVVNDAYNNPAIQLLV